MTPSIFIQIAAYRDPETLPTIRDALAKALYPERISIGLCWQYLPDADEPLLPASELPDCVRLLSVPAHESRGVCWARQKVQALYDDETYTLSIDSHMRFAPHWDQILIEELQRCDSEHAILSCYPPDYDADQDTMGEADNRHDAIVMVVGSVLEGGIPRFAGHLIPATPSRPLRGLFAAAGFHFGPGHLIENVPIDPAYYFNQEEAALAVKLWTHGYDIYSPTRQVIFHQYMNLPHGEARRPLHWEDHDNWGAIHKQGVERLLHILNVESASNLDALRDIEHYPLGSQRSLNEFMRLSGIDFSSADKTSRAANGEFIAELNPWFSPDQATAAPSIRTVI